MLGCGKCANKMRNLTILAAGILLFAYSTQVTVFGHKHGDLDDEIYEHLESVVAGRQRTRSDTEAHQQDAALEQDEQPAKFEGTYVVRMASMRNGDDMIAHLIRTDDMHTYELDIDSVKDEVDDTEPGDRLSITAVRRSKDTLQVLEWEPAGLTVQPEVGDSQSGQWAAIDGDAISSQWRQLQTVTDVPVLFIIAAICTYPAVTTVEDLEKVIFKGPQSRARNLQSYYEECSQNMVTMDKTNSKIVGPVTVPCNYEGGNISFTDATCKYSDAEGWVGYAEQQAVELYGVDISQYKHVVLVMPQYFTTLRGCSWIGLGTLGPDSLLPDGSYGSSHVWISGEYWSQAMPYMHELGHTMYLHHSAVAKSNCVYCDMSCVMGDCCQTRCFNPVHNWQLGWGNPIAHMNENTLTPGTVVTFVLPEQQSQTSNMLLIVPDWIPGYGRAVRPFAVFLGYRIPSGTYDTELPADNVFATNIYSFDGLTSLSVRYSYILGSVGDGQMYRNNTMNLAIRQIQSSSGASTITICRFKADKETDCGNGLDDDCDGLIDDADPDCNPDADPNAQPQFINAPRPPIPVLSSAVPADPPPAEVVESSPTETDPLSGVNVNTELQVEGTFIDPSGQDQLKQNKPGPSPKPEKSPKIVSPKPKKSPVPKPSPVMKSPKPQKSPVNKPPKPVKQPVSKDFPKKEPVDIHSAVQPTASRVDATVDHSRVAQSGDASSDLGHEHSNTQEVSVFTDDYPIIWLDSARKLQGTNMDTPGQHAKMGMGGGLSQQQPGMVMADQVQKDPHGAMWPNCVTDDNEAYAGVIGPDGDCIKTNMHTGCLDDNEIEFEDIAAEAQEEELRQYELQQAQQGSGRKLQQASQVHRSYPARAGDEHPDVVLTADDLAVAGAGRRVFSEGADALADPNAQISLESFSHMHWDRYFAAIRSQSQSCSIPGPYNDARTRKLMSVETAHRRQLLEDDLWSLIHDPHRSADLDAEAAAQQAIKASDQITDSAGRVAATLQAATTSTQQFEVGWATLDVQDDGDDQQQTSEKPSSATAAHTSSTPDNEVDGGTTEARRQHVEKWGDMLAQGIAALQAGTVNQRRDGLRRRLEQGQGFAIPDADHPDHNGIEGASFDPNEAPDVDQATADKRQQLVLEWGQMLANGFEPIKTRYASDGGRLRRRLLQGEPVVTLRHLEQVAGGSQRDDELRDRFKLVPNAADGHDRKLRGSSQQEDKQA